MATSNLFTTVNATVKSAFKAAIKATMFDDNKAAIELPNTVEPVARSLDLQITFTKLALLMCLQLY